MFIGFDSQFLTDFDISLLLLGFGVTAVTGEKHSVNGVACQVKGYGEQGEKGHNQVSLKDQGKRCHPSPFLIAIRIFTPFQGFFLGVLAKTQFVQNAKTQFETTKNSI